MYIFLWSSVNVINKQIKWHANTAENYYVITTYY